MCVCVCVRVLLGLHKLPKENAEDRARRLRSALIREKLLDKMSYETLRGAIKRELKYSDPRTIKVAVEDLLDFRLIFKAHTASGMKYAVNLEHEDFDSHEYQQQLTLAQSIRGVDA